MKNIFRLGTVAFAALALALGGAGTASALVSQSVGTNINHGICSGNNFMSTDANGEVYAYTHGGSNSVDAKKCVYTQFVRVFSGGGYYDRPATSVDAYAESGGYTTTDLFTAGSDVWAVQLWSKAWNGKQGDSRWYVLGINADGSRYITQG